MHRGVDFSVYVEEHFLQDFAKMAACDYLFVNPDRHANNWGFFVDADTNDIVSIAPLYDHNQALISDELGNDISELIYEPTGTTIWEAARRYAPCSGLEIETEGMDSQILERFQRLDIEPEWEAREKER